MSSARRVSTSLLKVGMYVTRLGESRSGPAPFAGSFLVSDQDEIQRIVDAGIQEVWIGEGKGVDGAGGRLPSRAPAAAGAAPSAPAAIPDAVPAPAPAHIRTKSSLEVEVGRAKRIVFAAKGQVLSMFQDARLGKAIDPEKTLPLVGEISASVARHPAAMLSVARLKTHDDYTYMHSVAVCALMVALARQLNMNDDEIRLAGHGGLMHDLGKAAMPLEVLNKPGKLTDAEFEIVKRHPEAGARILQEGGALEAVQDIALHHHEKVDGTGYPHKLGADHISVLARMGAVCDIYDAVTSERAYKKAWDPAGTMRAMARWHGHFDKRIFEAFVKSVGIYPPGSLVRLSSQRLAVVVESGIDNLLLPRVRAFYSMKNREWLPLETIDLAAPGCQERIMGPEDPAKWGFQKLEDLLQD